MVVARGEVVVARGIEVVVEGGGARWWWRGRGKVVVGTCDLEGGVRYLGGGGEGEG